MTLREYSLIFVHEEIFLILKANLKKFTLLVIYLTLRATNLYMVFHLTVI